MKHFFSLTLFTLSLTVCRAQVNVTMFQNPIVVVGTPGVAPALTYSLDFENNGIPDLKFITQYNAQGRYVDVVSENNQNIEVDLNSSNFVYAYNCGAQLGNGDWESYGELASYYQSTFYAGAGIKYLGFRKYHHTAIEFGSHDYHVYGWVKLEISADRRTVTIYGFGIGTNNIIESSQPNVYAGEGNCDVSVQEHSLPADAVTVLGNTVQVKSQEPTTVELFDFAGKLLFTDRKNGGNALFQLPSTNSLALLRVTAGIKSRTVKIKL